MTSAKRFATSGVVLGYIGGALGTVHAVFVGFVIWLLSVSAGVLSFSELSQVFFVVAVMVAFPVMGWGAVIASRWWPRAAAVVMLASGLAMVPAYSAIIGPGFTGSEIVVRVSAGLLALGSIFVVLGLFGAKRRDSIAN